MNLLAPIPRLTSTGKEACRAECDEGKTEILHPLMQELEVDLRSGSSCSKASKVPQVAHPGLLAGFCPRTHFGTRGLQRMEVPHAASSSLSKTCLLMGTMGPIAQRCKLRRFAKTTKKNPLSWLQHYQGSRTRRAAEANTWLTLGSLYNPHVFEGALAFVLPYAFTQILKSPTGVNS